MKRIFNFILLSLILIVTQGNSAYGHGGDEEFIPSDGKFIEVEKGIDILQYALYIVPGILISLSLAMVFFYKKNKQ